MAVDASNIVIRVVSDAIPEEAQVVELDGREAISELFEFRILITIPGQTGVEAADVIGSRIAVVFESLPASKKATELRRLHGLVVSCEDLLRDGDLRTYRLRVMPRLWMSTLVETLDIQQNVSLPDIVKKKLTALNLTEGDDFDFRHSGTYAPREFTVQYKETDLAFMSRLTEHMGISYFFEHRDGNDVVCFADDRSGFKPIEGDEIPFRSGGERTGIFDLVAEEQIVPSNFFQRDYNYRNPGADLLAQDSFDGFGGGIVEYGAHFKDAEEGKSIAVLRRQESECRKRIFRGQGADPRVSAGMTFKVADHPHGDIELLPFVVHHRVKQTAVAGGDGTAEGYTCTFEAIDAGLTFRPERTTPKPRIWGVVTGIIDSAGAGEYADIDEAGRYRVRFMFDTSGPDEGKASRPVRMMQPHAGGGYGLHFPLRRGVEVLIVFIDGDPDRPIICGTVPNPQTPSPVDTGNSQKNIIRTGGGNEIAIDDTKGSERIKFIVPHAKTVFQLGAPNLAESGAALQTIGAWTASAAAGATVVSSFKANMQIIESIRSAGNIVSVAEKPNKEKLTLLGFDLAKGVVAVAQSLLGYAKAYYAAWEKEEYGKAVAEQDDATKIWENCNKCLDEAAKLAAKLPDDFKDLAEAQLKDSHLAQQAYEDSLNTRRLYDSAREANIGSWTDMNEVAHQRNKEKQGNNYVEAKKKAAAARDAAAESKDLLNKRIDEAIAKGKATGEDKKKLEAYKAKLEACQKSRKGLEEQTAEADKKLDKYFKLRDDNGDAHIFMSKAETRLGQAGLAVDRVRSLVSIIMGIWAKLQKTVVKAGIAVSWSNATFAIEKGDARKKVDPPETDGGEPLHSIGSTCSTEVKAAEDLILHAPIVRMYGEGFGKGRAAITAEDKVSVVSRNEATIAARNTLWMHGTTVDIRAQNHGDEKGSLSLTAKDAIDVSTDEKDIAVLVKKADQKLSLGAGTAESDPKVTLQSHGAGTITAATHAWTLEMDEKGMRAGKEGKGEWQLDDDQALFKKQGSSIKLDDRKGTLAAEVWSISSQETKIDMFIKQIKLHGPDGIEAKSGSNVDVKCKKMVVTSDRIELG